MTSSPGRALIGAALVFTVAIFMFGRALVRAMVVDTGTAEPLPAFTPIEPMEREGPPLTGDALMLAIESDPFQPDRSRPTERYRLPGEEEAPPPPEAPPAPPAPDFRLGGTVVFDGGGMALIGLGEEDRLVNVGEMVGGYRLQGVNARQAMLENQYGMVTLEVDGPPQTVAAEVDEEEGRNRRGQRGRSADERQELIQRQMMQQLIQRARQGGATAEQVQAIQRMIQSGASNEQLMPIIERIMRSAGGDVVEVAPDRVIRRRAPPPPPPPGGRVPPPTR